MKSRLKGQFDLDFESRDAGEASDATARHNVRVDVSSERIDGEFDRSSAPLNAGVSGPSYLAQAQKGMAYAITARAAGRLNAASISDEEYQAFLREREQLLTNKYAGDYTRKDELRLRYVRWTLDRIEDARYGHNLDVLDSLVAQYEHVVSEIGGLEQQLRGLQKGRR